MSEQKAGGLKLDTIPEVAINARSGLSLVWLIPIVAALIGIWIAYKTISEQGPTITLTFKTAEGIEAEKTKIKYKDVEIGVVESVRISEDSSHVILTAELVTGAEAYITENTRFWVVRPRVAAGEISGIGTLFSGAYIGVDPGKPGNPAHIFKGLEKPPIVTADAPGHHYLLRASTLGSLDIGSPVYYRQINVGKVVGYELDQAGETADIRVFINAPHHTRVQKNTRFWNASGLDFSLGAEGVKVKAQSVVTLLLGGIAFDTPKNLGTDEPAEADDVFKLYESYEDIRETSYVKKEYYVVYFDSSVRGLKPGAPVEFRGIKVGEVIDIRLEFHTDKFVFKIPVLIEIEPERIAIVGEQLKDNQKAVDRLVERGLRAQLKTGNFLTGQLLVDLNFSPQAQTAQVVYEGKYAVLPTIPAPLEEITASMTQLVHKVDKFPIEQIGKGLQQTLESTDRLLNSADLLGDLHLLNKTLQGTQQLVKTLDSRVATKAQTTLEQTQMTLAAMENALNSNSPLRRNLSKTLQELSAAARSIHLMADYLERHPNALLYGKAGKQQ